jgi:hypothetical protein
MGVAHRDGDHWFVERIAAVPSSVELLKLWLLTGQSVLAGFDFPIGLPAQYGERTGFENFLEALPHLGQGEWADFFLVAKTPTEISLHRPFYPANALLEPRRKHLLEGLGCDDFDQLRRICERKCNGRRAASPIFWTVGANQVGKAAIDGWQNILRPALAGGAKLWPFQGSLSALSEFGGCVLCETYPQEAYGHIGVKLQSSRRGEGKSTQVGRQRVSQSIAAWAQTHHARLDRSLETQIQEGFGESRIAEDQFDALIGLLSMIAVVNHTRRDGCPSPVSQWEGWILGQLSDSE